MNRPTANEKYCKYRECNIFCGTQVEGVWVYKHRFTLSVVEYKLCLLLPCPSVKMAPVAQFTSNPLGILLTSHSRPVEVNDNRFF